jgi:tetratricopeptide (TPR) repeat protein
MLRSLPSGTGAIAVIEGEPGIGKTTLVDNALAAAESGPRIVRVRCVPSRLSPLYELVEGLGNAGLGMLVADRPPRLEALYLMTASGLLAARAQRQEGLDADIFSGMLTAVRQFVADSMSSLDDAGERGTGPAHSAGLSRLDYNQYKVVMIPSGSSNLVAVVSGSENEFLRDDLEQLAREVSEGPGAGLDAWDGTQTAVAGLDERLSSLISSGRYDGLDEAVDEPRLKRERLYSNIIRGLRREAQRAGLVVFIDDAQWADEGTVALLQPLGLATVELPLVIILTVRPGEAPDHLKAGIQRLSRESRLVRVELGRRDAGEIGRILEARIGRFEPSLLARVRDEGQGNPLYCLEVARYLVDHGMVESSPDGFRARPDAKFDIPAKARDVILARVSNLNDREARVLEIASVLGDQFDPKVVTHALGPAVAQDLEALERRHRLIRPAKAGFEFDHAWTRDAVYGSLGEARRASLHGQAARSLEALHGSEDRRAAEVAEHWRLAGEAELALAQFRRAAKVAAGRYENDAAAAALRSALELAPAEEEEGILAELGSVLEAAGKYGDAQEAYSRLVGIAEAAGEFRKVGEWKTKLGNLLGGLRSDIPAAEEYFASADALLEMEGDVPGRVRLATARGAALLRVGDYQRGEAILRGAIDSARAAGMPAMDVAAAENPLAGILYKTGRVEEALALMNDCVRIWRDARLERRVALGYHNIALIYKEKSDFARSREMLTVALKMAEKVGSINTVALARYSLSLVLRHVERLPEARAEAERAADLFRITGDLGGAWKTELSLANTLADLGEHAAAMPHAERSVRDGRGRTTPAEAGDALTLLGALRARTGDLRGAEEPLHEAAGLLDQSRGKDEHRRHLLTVAELAVERGDAPAAETALRELDGFAAASGKAEKAKRDTVAARWHLLRGEPVRAVELAKSARAVFAELKLETSLARAERLLAECAAAIVSS